VLLFSQGERVGFEKKIRSKNKVKGGYLMRERGGGKVGRGSI